MARKRAPRQVYQVKVTLKGSKPPIWRRAQVPSDIRLDELHDILQTVMGWHGYHLHDFVHQGREYGDPETDDFIPAPSLSDPFLDLLGRHLFEHQPAGDERRVRLNQLLRTPDDKLRYRYDFGDDWQHDVLLEKVLLPEIDVEYPVCIKGRRRCPPEDVGGIWSYGPFLEAIKDPKTREDRERLEWVGGSFDPETFDVNAVNALLHREGSRLSR